MEMSNERKEKIVSDMQDILGVAGVVEWAGNTSYLMGSLLKANGVKPEGLEEQIALSSFFIEIIKKVFNVDPEIMELEDMKCYRKMEQIIEEAHAKVKAQQEEDARREAEMHQHHHIPDDFSIPEIEVEDAANTASPVEHDMIPGEASEVSTEEEAEDPPEKVTGEVEG